MKIKWNAKISICVLWIFWCLKKGDASFDTWFVCTYIQTDVECCMTTFPDIKVLFPDQLCTSTPLSDSLPSKLFLSVIWFLVLIQIVTVIFYCSRPSTAALDQWKLVLYSYVHSSHVALVGFSDFLHHLLFCSCTVLDGARHCDGPLWVVQGQVLETGPNRTDAWEQ